MFLRKWKTGQVAVGLMMVALLVLGGLNLSGLVKGQNAINDASARPKIWFLLAFLEFDSVVARKEDGSVVCGGAGITCIHTRRHPDSKSVPLDKSEILFSF